MICQLQADPRRQVRFNSTTLGKSSSPVLSPRWQSPLHICPHAHPCCAPEQNSSPGSCLVGHFPVRVVNGVTEQCAKSHWVCMIISRFIAERSYFIFAWLWIILLTWKAGLQDGKERMCRAVLPCGANIQQVGSSWWWLFKLPGWEGREPENWFSPSLPQIFSFSVGGSKCSFTFFSSSLESFVSGVVVGA